MVFVYLAPLKIKYVSVTTMSLWRGLALTDSCSKKTASWNNLFGKDSTHMTLEFRPRKGGGHVGDA